MKRAAAIIVHEYSPFPDDTNVAGVSYDGTNVWIATGDKLNAVDPASGKAVRALDVPAHAGTAFDGQHLFQISGDRIQKVDPESGRMVATIPTPEGGASGMAWAEGTLWVAQHRKRKIHQVDPQTGAILRTIEFEPFRYRRHLGGWRALARYLGSRAKRTAPDRSAERRGTGAARHAGRHCRIGTRVKWQRYLLLRRRKQRKSESRPPTCARLHSNAPKLGPSARQTTSEPRRSTMSASAIRGAQLRGKNGHHSENLRCARFEQVGDNHSKGIKDRKHRVSL